MEELIYLGISSSPRHANTETMVKKALDSARDETEKNDYSVRIKYISLAGKTVKPCTNCEACVRKGTYCTIKDDWLEVVGHLIDPVPNGFILGSPVYFFNVNAQMRAFMERCTSLMKALWHPEFPHPAPDWSRTAAGAVAVGWERNGGQEVALTTIIQFFLLNEFVTVAPAHGPGLIGVAGWQMGHPGTNQDSVRDDKLGIEQCVNLGQRIARTAILLSGKQLKAWSDKKGGIS